jgi:hypothetical protein
MPWYMMPFDRDGICTGPETRKHLLAAVAKEAFTDIYLFSHGWNNDWKDATDRYQSFIDGYSKLRAARQLPLPDGYHPLRRGYTASTERRPSPDTATSAMNRHGGCLIAQAGNERKLSDSSMSPEKSEALRRKRWDAWPDCWRRKCRLENSLHPLQNFGSAFSMTGIDPLR